jgi:predicted metal-dependent hydrolase
MPSRQTRTSLRFHDIHVPLLIIEESRKDARVSLGQSAAYLRIPYTAPREFKQEKLVWAKKWLLEILQEKPGLAERWRNKEYHSGMVIKTALKSYVLDLSTNQNRSTGTAKVDGNDLILRLPRLDAGEYYTRDDIASLISRGIAADLLPEFSERVHAYNRAFYRETIASIRLKYTHSRWGSCAFNGNLNFSTKILLAPEHIMDHIIIHELAHLKELNHSDRFWKWVEKADPQYKRHAKWLSVHGDKLDF